MDDGITISIRVGKGQAEVSFDRRAWKDFTANSNALFLLLMKMEKMAAAQNRDYIPDLSSQTTLGTSTAPEAPMWMWEEIED